MTKMTPLLAAVILVLVALSVAGTERPTEPAPIGDDLPDGTGTRQPLESDPISFGPSEAASGRADRSLHFEPNRGQTHEDVLFTARAEGYTFFLTPKEAVFAVEAADTGSDRSTEQHVVRLGFVDAQADPLARGKGKTPGISNYLVGDDTRSWTTDVPHYNKVLLADVWPGIDIEFYGTPQRAVQYDVHVGPGADPDAIRFAPQGTTPRLMEDGNLKMPLGDTELHQPPPFTFQWHNGIRHEIASRFMLEDDGTIGFALDAYDPTVPLIIDPVVTRYSSYLGGSNGDTAGAVTSDTSGHAYVLGDTNSVDFPTANAYQGTHPGRSSMFITKFAPDGATLVYSTYLGGSGLDVGTAIAEGDAGSAYVTGWTSSDDFPTTPGALQTSHPGGFRSGFVTKLDPAGNALDYSTYLGGSDTDTPRGISVDGFGNAFVAGQTRSSDFPVTGGAHDPNYPGGTHSVFMSKMDLSGSALVAGTYLGGPDWDEAWDIDVDNDGDPYVTGRTYSTGFPTTAGAFQVTHPGGGTAAFVTKLEDDLSGLLYSTFLGGSNNDHGFAIAVDGDRYAYVTGSTRSTDFPTTTGAFQSTHPGDRSGFVTKLDKDPLSGLVFSSFLGGGSVDVGRGIAVDNADVVHVTGQTSSNDFPTTPLANQPSAPGSLSAFITLMAADGTALEDSSYLGGSGNEDGLGLAVDTAGDTYVTGWTASHDFPTTSGAFQETYPGAPSAFVVKLGQPLPPAPLAIAAGGWTTCTLLVTADVECWGYNGFGNAAGHTAPPAATEISVGRYHSCAVLSTGDVDCWGRNTPYGQSTGHTSPPDAVQVDSGDKHSCALLANGWATCWGWSAYGQTAGYSGLIPATQVGAGGFHSCALLLTGAVTCWGWNGFGQSAGYTGPPAAVDLALGDTHTCAVLVTGDVDCWGRDNFNQVSGMYTGPIAATQVTSGESHSCVTLMTGDVECWGRDSFNQVSGGYTGPPMAINVAAGLYHTCALLITDAVECWGLNNQGQADPYP